MPGGRECTRMADYRLDDLGWYHFEQLMQGLLKAEHGFGVEAWGGSGDFGRDAYSAGPLRFPTKHVVNDGPFIFQAKFIQQANATGAHWLPSLTKAARAEAKRIEQRCTQGKWTTPRFYCLMTNAPIGAPAKDAVGEILSAVLPDATIITLGARDVAASLNARPELRRAFPELLSIRDFDELLRSVVDSAILERSRSAVQEAREVSRVFVPTAAYEKAWCVLRDYSFVVLDGPPEMGKTSIARLMSFALLLDGWEVVECRGPDDFFKRIDSDRRQVFVADDAFGRTEYNPALGREWERDLPRVLNRIDRRHCLIWTTRKHILARALREMDLTGTAQVFPDPAEVVVTADALSVEEKARMLYRHAKAENLALELRNVVRDNALAIVNNDHFTPERIRRFVVERLPDLGDELTKRVLAPSKVTEEVLDAIQNPTGRMRRSHKKLPRIHRSILISLLEFPETPDGGLLKSRLESHLGPIGDVAFAEALDDLVGSFIRQIEDEDISDQYDWIHPSYRDLVIDELSDDPVARIAFLNNANTDGVRLALSEEGGGTGIRRLPLMAGEESWSAVANRVDALGAETHQSLGQLAEIVASALGSEHESEHADQLQTLGLRICTTARRVWTNHTPDPKELRSYERLAELIEPRPPFPSLRATWESTSEWLGHWFTPDDVLEYYQIESWLECVDLVREHDQALYESDGFQERFCELHAVIVAELEENLLLEPEYEDPSDNETEAQRLENVALAIKRFDHCPRGASRPLSSFSDSLRELASEFHEYAVPDDPDAEGYSPPSPSPGDFDVKALFSDL